MLSVGSPPEKVEQVVALVKVEQVGALDSKLVCEKKKCGFVEGNMVPCGITQGMQVKQEK